MEIEARFTIPDAETCRQLQALDRLAGFALSAGYSVQVHDTYLDTAERLILAAGYVCRKREAGGSVEITLKARSKGEGAIWRREELEVVLPAYGPPAQWPPGALRARVQQLIGTAPLVPLFDLRQTRLVRQARQGARAVAQVSLDQVRVEAGDQTHIYYVLEIELLPQGTEQDLAACVACLQNDWRLAPEPLSKFERALALFGMPDAAMLQHPQL